MINYKVFEKKDWSILNPEKKKKKLKFYQTWKKKKLKFYQNSDNLKKTAIIKNFLFG